MPWHLEGANPDCDGIAVVDDDTGKIIDCHEREDDAQAQLASLRSAEAEAPPPKRAKGKEG